MTQLWTSAPGRRALVTGASGTVGQALAAQLGSEVVATTRDRGRAVNHAAETVTWDGESALPPAALREVDSVFHLAGEPVVDGRWDTAKKDRILLSRVDSTRALVRAFADLEPSARPRVLVCASAVGIYGSRGEELLTEKSAPAGGFLVEVCRAWEEEAARARDLGVRVVSLRIGIVLATEGGALAKMLPLFRLGLGGRLGDGKQWMPWIHIDDIVGLLRFAAANEHVSGPVNAAAPQPVQNVTFTRALGEAVHRPALLPAPAFALRIALGEAASVILASQHVVPARAIDAGYRFVHPTLAGALASLVGAGEARSPVSSAAL
jgi:uncharacterized protein (TIGR01777 family)